MPKKYQIHAKNADPRFPPVGKYATVEFRENCAGSCRECVKKKCVYGVYKDNFAHWSQMTGPDYQYICKSCYRCVQECTKGIFSMAINPEYRRLGDDYWTPAIINSTWAQAHTGKVPVSGAGYRGPFAGEGFDSIWTDMSEIVRPTRDGIHGREYINTSVELSRRPGRLEFGADAKPKIDARPVLEIPLPILLQEPSFGRGGEAALLGMLKAAQATGTLMFIKPDSYTPDLTQYAPSIVLCLTRQNWRQSVELVRNSRLVELAYDSAIADEFVALKQVKPDLSLCVGVPLDRYAAERTLELAKAGADCVHIYATEHARGTGPVAGEESQHLKDAIREIHSKLVENGLRHSVNLIFSGGVAAAEHVAKAMLCGGDAVVIDIPLLLALECRLCRRCQRDGSQADCPVKMSEVNSDWASQRIVNLLSAWHSQLLEVMGACGIREARRMRGEAGRAMFFEDLERDSFGPLFGTRKAKAVR